MTADKLTDEERRARALTLEQITVKLKTEYGDALAALGFMPVVQRVWPYTVESHVENARRRGITIDAGGQYIQRDYLDLLRGASPTELAVVVRVLNALLKFDMLHSTDHHRLVNEIIHILTYAETTTTV